MEIRDKIAKKTIKKIYGKMVRWNNKANKKKGRPRKTAEEICTEELNKENHLK